MCATDLILYSNKKCKHKEILCPFQSLAWGPVVATTQSSCDWNISTPQALSGPHLASSSVFSPRCGEAPRACPASSGAGGRTRRAGAPARTHTSVPALVGGLVPLCGHRPCPQKCGATPAAPGPSLQPDCGLALSASCPNILLFLVLVGAHTHTCTRTHVRGA